MRYSSTHSFSPFLTRLTTLSLSLSLSLHRWLHDMWEFNFATKSWREIEARGTLPSVRSCPAWAKDDTHVYIHGGYDGVERKSDFFACDLATYTWTEMPCRGTPPSPRYFHSCKWKDTPFSSLLFILFSILSNLFVLLAFIPFSMIRVELRASPPLLCPPQRPP